jgi:hypothetical protein
VSSAKTRIPQSGGLNSPGTVCRDRLARPGRYRAFAPVNRRYRSGDAPPSFVVGKRNTSRLSIVITVSRPAECACRMRRNPASVSSIIPSSWTTKSRPGSRGRQSGMALARHESKCVQGATTEISRRTLSASAIAQSPYSRPLVIARRPPLPSITPKGPRVKKSAPLDIRRRPFAHAYLLAALLLGGLHGARAQRGHNLRITGAAPRRWGVVAFPYPRFRCAGLDRRRPLSGRHPRP